MTITRAADQKTYCQNCGHCSRDNQWIHPVCLSILVPHKDVLLCHVLIRKAGSSSDWWQPEFLRWQVGRWARDAHQCKFLKHKYQSTNPCEPAPSAQTDRHCWWSPRTKVPCQTHHSLRHLLHLLLSLFSLPPQPCSCGWSQLVFFPHTPSNCFTPSSVSSWMSHLLASQPMFHYKLFPWHDVDITGQLHNFLTYYRRRQESNCPWLYLGLLVPFSHPQNIK